MKAALVLTMAATLMGCKVEGTSTERDDASILVVGKQYANVKNVSYWDFFNDMPIHWQCGTWLFDGDPTNSTNIAFYDKYGVARILHVDKKLENTPKTVKISLNEYETKREEYSLKYSK